MKKQLTVKQIKKKYNNIYVEVCKSYDHTNQCWLYDVIKTSKTIKENMTLGQDLETSMEYCR